MAPRTSNNLKEELAKKTETTAGENKLKKSMSIAVLIKAMLPEIKKALPEVITPERFTRMALSALHDRGDIRLFYGFFKLVNGGFGFEVMSKEAVDAYAKEYSKSFDASFSPWKTNYEAMAKKIRKIIRIIQMKEIFQRISITIAEGKRNLKWYYNR